jgi:uncharacterized protein
MDEPRVPGALLVDVVVPARAGWSGVIAAGDVLRVVDLHGRQAVDFLCYNARDPSERYNAADTMKIAGNVYLGAGSRLYSDLGHVLLTIVEDTCGRHDTIGGCCSVESNRVRYGIATGPSCRDNFLGELARHGLGKKDIVANVNLFMAVPVGADGAMAIVDGHSKAGDHVDLRAEMDVLAVISNCPQMNNPAAGYAPTPIRVLVWRPDRGRARGPQPPGKPT